MKSTDHFKDTIKRFLQAKGKEDLDFRKKLLDPKKKLADCITYILNQVKKSGCNGFSDDEIYGMALHYYDEEDINPGESIKCSVVVNHQVELTPEEIEEQKKKAKEDVFRKEQERLTKKKKKKPSESTAIQPVDKDLKQQPSTLF